MSQARDTLGVGGVRITAELVEAAMRVRATSPAALQSLAEAVRAQADASARALVHASPEVVQAAQGRAQAFDALAMLFASPDVYFIQYGKRSI